MKVDITPNELSRIKPVLVELSRDLGIIEKFRYAKIIKQVDEIIEVFRSTYVDAPDISEYRDAMTMIQNDTTSKDLSEKISLVEKLNEKHSEALQKFEIFSKEVNVASNTKLTEIELGSFSISELPDSISSDQLIALLPIITE